MSVFLKKDKRRQDAKLINKRNDAYFSFSSRPANNRAVVIAEERIGCQ
jgi:hypothetical protein